MTICIPTTEQKGLDSSIASHFGSSPHFALLDLEKMSVEFLGQQEEEPEGAGCRGANAVGDQAVDAVFCQSMGRGALAAMESMGIPVYVTEATTVREVLQAIMKNEVQRLDAAEACAGHGGGGCCGGH